MDKNIQGRIRELHSGSFKTVKEIAEETGLDSEIVVFELEAMGYRPRYEKEKPEPSEFLMPKTDRPKKSGPYRVPEETREKIITLRKAGKTFRQIATVTGIKEPTVKTIVRKELLKGKEPAPSANDASSADDKKITYDYHTAFYEACQESADIIASTENWLKEFIEEVYNYQSEEWQHGYDTAEKLADLRNIIRKAKGESV